MSRAGTPRAPDVGQDATIAFTGDRNAESNEFFVFHGQLTLGHRGAAEIGESAQDVGNEATQLASGGLQFIVNVVHVGHARTLALQQLLKPAMAVRVALAQIETVSI